MDVAYDHIQEESFSPNSEHPPSAQDSSSSQPQNLSAEFQQAYKAVSSSPWGMKLGGWFGEAKKQGEAFYSDLQKEATEAQTQATKGFEGLRDQLAQRTRGMSLNAPPGPESSIPGVEAVPESNKKGKQPEVTLGAQAEAEVADRPESLPADIVKEAGSLVASFRNTAAAKLKDLQKAEDAADEALLKFGANVRNFLRDAVVITAPTEGDANKPKGTDAAGNEVLFETTEQGTGRKVFHTTRLDAQLHAIHTTAGTFTEDPQGEQYQEWVKEFDIDKQTDAIAKDLDKYEELRRAMEKLVPEKVEYKNFWIRYYFLRKAIEEDERRRKELLRGAADTEEEVAWDDDDEDENGTTSTPQPKSQGISHKASESTTTLNAPTVDKDMLKPSSPRRSHEDEAKSVADSDASYDLVSGAVSRAPGSPKEAKKAESGKEDSDDDWE